MQIRNGKLKLPKKDYRVGNFVISEEENHVKVQDISQIMSFRVSKFVPNGQLLLAMVKDRQDTGLQNYIAVAYNFLSAIPDIDMLTKVNEEVVACIGRHREFYGMKEDITKEEDDAILDEVRETAEATQEFLDNLPEEGQGEDVTDAEG